MQADRRISSHVHLQTSARRSIIADDNKGLNLHFKQLTREVVT